MSVHEGVDAFISKLGDELVNLGQVGLVVNSRSSLDGFPHDTKSDKVESPCDQLIHVLLGQRSLRVELVLLWDVWWHLVDHVDSMEDNMTSCLLTDHAVFRIDPNIPGVS
jgi:hypothetical protein